MIGVSQRLMAVLLAVLCAACAGAPVPGGSTPPATGSPDASTGEMGAGPTVVRTVATGLSVPWSMARLADGSVLATHRDDGTVTRVDDAGEQATVGRVAGVVPGGEGGLLGIAVSPDTHTVYVYLTAAQDNRVVAFSWNGERLTGQRTILSGIPKGNVHDGGRIAFGPDGYLYVATGETGQEGLAQDLASLGGKILRITADGAPAPGNPFPDSPVYSYGHRNVQGLAWDTSGRLWASEFGLDDADELNLIEPGGNYGWPMCEGRCDVPGTIQPQVVWSPTAIASPSGMAIVNGSAWIASLRGGTLWQVPLKGPAAGQPVPWFAGQFGRLRDVVVMGPDVVWVATGNTDGRGSPGADDDRIVELRIRIGRDAEHGGASPIVVILPAGLHGPAPRHECRRSTSEGSSHGHSDRRPPCR